MSYNRTLAAVKKNALFTGVGDTDVNFKFNPKDFIEKGDGEIIYQSGDACDCLYLIIEGEVKLKIPGGVSSPLLLTKIDNDFFGEKEVLENSVRKSSAVVNKNSLIYIIPKNELNNMIEGSKGLRYNLLGDMKEDSEIETTPKGAVSNELIDKLFEQPFYKSDNTIPEKDSNNDETEVIGTTEEETNNETEVINSPALLEVSENNNDIEAINENNLEIKDTWNIDVMDINEVKPNLSINTDINESEQEQINSPLFLLISAFQKIFSNINPDEIFISIPEAISTLLNANRGILYVINNENKEFRTRKKTESEYADISIMNSGNLFSESMNDDKIININCPPEEQLAPIYLTANEEIKNLLIVPIKNNENKIIGVIQLIDSNKGRFDSADEKLITELSPLIALAIENSEYIQNLLNSDRLVSMNKIANFIVHDIKNPIVTIKQYSEHIKKQNVSKEINHVLDMIVEQTNFVVDLVQTTLGYSEGKSISNLQPILLTNALDYILSMLAEYVESRNVKLFKKFEGDGLVNLDKKEFYQVCFQIAKNACDAMPKGGNFYIITKREGDKVHIKLKDHGLGIPDSIKDRIFEPFMTHGKKQKSGLGLAIAEKIIKEHNGMIWAESDLGEGTVITIVLPVLG